MPISMRRRSLLATGSAAAARPAIGQAAPGRDTDTVRLTWGFGGLPLIAKERGELVKTLARDNIRVEWIGPFPNHAPTIQAVVGGSADFSFGGSTTPALAAILGGSPLVFSLFAVVEPRSTAIIARDGSGINTVADLAGRSVAVNRSGLGEFLLVAALEKSQVDRSKVRFVYLNPPEAAPAFGSGQVDAWAMWSPGVDIARSQYKAHDIFLEGRDLDFQIDFNSWLVRKAFAVRNRDLVNAVNAALAAEAEWASTHIAEAETIAQAQGHYDASIRETYISWKRQYHVRRVDDQAFLADLQRAADWLAAQGPAGAGADRKSSGHGVAPPFVASWLPSSLWKSLLCRYVVAAETGHEQITADTGRDQRTPPLAYPRSGFAAHSRPPDVTVFAAASRRIVPTQDIKCRFKYTPDGASPPLGLLAALPRPPPASAPLRVGDQKGGVKSLMTASGALDGIERLMDWTISPAAAPLLEALNAGAIDCGGVGDAPFAFARVAGIRAKVISATRSSGAGTALLVPAASTAQSFTDLKGARLERAKVRSGTSSSCSQGNRQALFNP